MDSLIRENVNRLRKKILKYFQVFSLFSKFGEANTRKISTGLEKMFVTFEIFSTISGCQDGRMEGPSQLDLTQNVTALNENLSSPSLSGLAETSHFGAEYLKTFILKQ